MNPLTCVWGAVGTVRFLKAASVGGLVLAALAFVGAWSASSGRVWADDPSPVLAASPGEESGLDVLVHKTTSKYVTIIAADDRCDEEKGCSRTLGLPVAVPPSATRSIAIRFTARSPGADFPLRVTTDDPDHPELLVTIRTRRP